MRTISYQHPSSVVVVLKLVHQTHDQKDKDHQHQRDGGAEVGIVGVAEELGLDKALERLKTLAVVKLRRLAREYKTFGITGRAVSKADKRILLAEFRAYYTNN